MVKYFMKVVVLFIIFSLFFITSNSSFILINNASAYEKENYGSSTIKDFDKKKYENNINEYNNLGKEKKETSTAHNAQPTRIVMTGIVSSRRRCDKSSTTRNEVGAKQKKKHQPELGRKKLWNEWRSSSLAAWYESSYS